MIGAGPFLVAIGDPDSTRTVWAIVALLLVMGVGLVMVAFWLRRSTRPDPELLAPLEMMGERAWRRGDPVWQRRRLDEVRPDGAKPLRRAAAPPSLDESFDAGPSAGGFADLHDDAHPTDDGDGAVDGGVDGSVDGHESHAAHRHTPAGTPITTADGDGPAPDPSDPSDPSDDTAASDDGTSTPIGASRPFLDDLPDHEIDPDELRRAMSELEAELHPNPDD